MSEKVKQVIVWRKDIVCRKGKFGAQVSHASIAWLTNRLVESDTPSFDGAYNYSILLTKAEEEWVKGLFAKIVLQVENEKELVELYQRVKDAGLVVELITDAGLTEFHGVPTKTCLAIGPDYSNRIDAITGGLKLY